MNAGGGGIAFCCSPPEDLRELLGVLFRDAEGEELLNSREFDPFLLDFFPPVWLALLLERLDLPLEGVFGDVASRCCGV